MSDPLFDPAEAAPPEQRRRAQETALQDVLSRAAEVSPAVRAALAAAGLRSAEVTLATLARLPLLGKSQLPRLQAQDPPFGGWLGGPLSMVRRVFVSPGPIYEPEARGPDPWGFAPALFAAGFRPGDVVVNTFSYHLTPAGQMLDGGLDALGCITVPTGTGSLEIQLKTLQDTGARGFVGTPSFLLTLLERAAAGGIRTALEVAFVSGEPLPPTLRASIEAHGLRVSQGYATADCGLIAYECAQRRGLHVADRVIVELVDPQTGGPVPEGEAGEVVVTSLNVLYPLLRLATGDLSRAVPGICGCGRTAMRLERILGRVGEAVKVRGIFLLPHELGAAMRRHPEVRRYQALVTRAGAMDELTVRVEVEGPPPAGLAEAVAQTVREVTRLRAAVEIVAPGTLTDADQVLVDRRRWE